MGVDAGTIFFRVPQKTLIFTLIFSEQIYLKNNSTWVDGCHFGGAEEEDEEGEGDGDGGAGEASEVRSSSGSGGGKQGASMRTEGSSGGWKIEKLQSDHGVGCWTWAGGYSNMHQATF